MTPIFKSGLILIPSVTIDQKLVTEWRKLCRFSCKLGGYDLQTLKPFSEHEENYAQIIQHLKAEDEKGKYFYQLIAKECVWYKPRK